MPRDALRSQVTFAIVPIWVLERCSSPAVHVYGFLMKHANRDRRAWPKTEGLAVLMGKSLRSVERAIAELRRVGAVQTTRRHGPNGAVLGLDFVLIQVDPQAAILPASSGGKGPVHPATRVATIPPPVAGSKRSEEPDPENQIQERREDAPAAPARPVDPETFVIVWNASTTLPIPRCQGLTRNRRRLIRTALLEHPPAVWAAIFARVERSAFCRGEKGWVISLDWLIASPDRAMKVLEGHYDNRRIETDRVRLAPAAYAASAAILDACDHDPRCGSARLCQMRRDLDAMKEKQPA